MLTKTEAVVLKSMKYGDTSKIVTFYTRQFGKLKGIAKGARKANNKFGSGLEPFSRVSLVIYKKENRDLHLISQCDCIESYRKLHDNLERISAGLAVLELVDTLTHGEEENEPLFSLLVGTLSALNGAGRNFQSLQRAFQLKCAVIFGFAPSLEVCASCGRQLGSEEPLSHVGFQLSDGAIICSHCKRGGKGGNLATQMTISAPALRVLQRFLSAPTERIPAVSYNDQIGNELDEALRLYFRYHFDHARELKSVKLFKSIV
jgi:DNA repair protein RecO (recombination protein O)